MSTKLIKDQDILDRDVSKGYAPAHPGSILKEDFLDKHSMSIAQFAQIIGVDKAFVSRMVNEKVGVSPLMALRLGKALNTSVDLWINLQRNYDLHQASQKADLSKVKNFYEYTKNPKYSFQVKERPE